MDDFKELLNGQIPEATLNKCVQIIGKYTNNIANDAILFSNDIGGTYQGVIYKRLSLKRLCVRDSTFIKCSYIDCVSTGSTFQSAQFIDCEFENSNFQYANMSKSKIQNQSSLQNGINGSNFSNINFSGAVLNKIKLHGSSFSHSLFYNSIIDTCTITACSFEDTCFKGALLKNIDLSEANVEYADFLETIFENTKLSPMQLPYTYGGLDAFYGDKGIKLYAKHDNIQREITKKDFDVLLSNLCVYYAHIKEYFPLANILLFKKDRQGFYDIVMLAIKVACINRNLRDIKHIAKLIVQSKWYDSLQLKELYYTILKISFEKKDDLNYNFSAHIGEIQTLLLSSLCQQESIVARFVVDSHNRNIFKDISVISQFIRKQIKQIDYNINWDKIELRKNSPVDIVINFVFDNKDQVLDCIQRVCELIIVALPAYLTHRNKKQKPTPPTQNTNITIINSHINISRPIIIYKDNIFQEIADIDSFMQKLEGH